MSSHYLIQTSYLQQFLESFTMKDLQTIHGRVYTNRGTTHNKSSLVQRLVDSANDMGAVNWLNVHSGITKAEMVTFFSGLNAGIPTNENKLYYCELMMGPGHTSSSSTSSSTSNTRCSSTNTNGGGAFGLANTTRANNSPFGGGAFGMAHIQTNNAPINNNGFAIFLVRSTAVDRLSEDHARQQWVSLTDEQRNSFDPLQRAQLENLQINTHGTAQHRVTTFLNRAYNNPQALGMRELVHDCLWLRGQFNMFKDYFPVVYTSLQTAFGSYYQAYSRGDTNAHVWYQPTNQESYCNKLVHSTFEKCMAFAVSGDWTKIQIQIKPDFAPVIHPKILQPFLCFVFSQDKDLAQLIDVNGNLLT